MKTEEQIRKEKQKILDCLKLDGGIICRVVKRVGISSKTFYEYYRTDPDFRQKVELLKDEMIDMAESKLMELVEQGDRQSIIFLLKTQGKKRGWGESIDIQGQLEEPKFVFRITSPDVETKKILQESFDIDFIEENE